MFKVSIKSTKRSTGSRNTSGSFVGSKLDIRNKATQHNAGGHPDYKLFLYINDHEGSFVFFVDPDPDAPADCPTQHPGFGVIKFDSDSDVHRVICGDYDGFKETMAAGVGYESWGDMNKSQLTPTRGWLLSPHTPMPNGRPRKTDVPRGYRLTVWHKEGCNFDKDGPQKFGDPTRAAYVRKNRAKRARA